MSEEVAGLSKSRFDGEGDRDELEDREEKEEDRGSTVTWGD